MFLFALIPLSAFADKEAASDEALALDPANSEARLALKALDARVRANPEVDELLQRRGVMRFFNADMAGAIADFDLYLKRHPAHAPHHWQRGIAYYYADEFEKGVAQFEIHQDVNSSDVENAVWHFMCVNRVEGFEAARKMLIPIKGDARVPMPEVHQLFAGEVEPTAVIAAAMAGSPSPDDLRNRLCYAHQYLGLYWEAKGDARKSLDHFRKSAVEFSMPHYMGEVSRVHLKVRGKK